MAELPMKNTCDTGPEVFIHCVFCHDPERSTWLLQCCHPVCNSCLTDRDVVRDGKILCEECSAVTPIADGKSNWQVRSQDWARNDQSVLARYWLSTSCGPCRLRPNYFKDIWTRFEEVFEVKPCIMCSARDDENYVIGTHVCLECDGDCLCAACLRIHASVGGTKHHRPVPLSGAGDPEWRHHVRSMPHVVCEEHKDTTPFYCCECQQPVCRQCLHLGHVSHRCIRLTDLCDQERQEVAALKHDLDERLSYAIWQKAEVEKLMELTCMEEETGANEIAEQMEAMKELLNEWGQAKTRELREFYHTARAQYEADAERWKATIAHLQTMSTFSKLNLQYASNKDMLYSTDSLQEDMRRMLQAHRVTEGPPLIHKNRYIKWNSMKTIWAKLDSVIGTAVVGGAVAMRKTKLILSPGQYGVVGLGLTEDQVILATGSAMGKVQAFDFDGVHAATITCQEVIAAWNVVVTDREEMYVSDVKRRQVRRIDWDGTTTHTIRLRGDGAECKNDRLGLALDSRAGILYISSQRKNTVYRCALDDGVAEPLITPDNSNPPLCSPHYIHVTHTGSVVVSNAGSHCVHVYNSHGQLRKVLGRKGHDLGQFNRALGVSSDAQGYLYVADRGNRRVQVIDSRYNFIGSFPQDDEMFQDPFPVAVNPAGDVLVGCANKISVFRPVRTLLA